MPSSRADSLSPTREETLPFIHDIIIIGAGPCGLAVAARLREQTPSALFTDEEHHRYHWINKHAAHASIKSSKTGRTTTRTSSTSKDADVSMLVLDSSGESWMSKWKRHFSELDISHLRSPMFFHPDPRDRDGLLAYAHAVGREDECLEIAGCVGKEISKHQMKKRKKRQSGQGSRASIVIDERDRKDYFVPPSDLFQDYCSFIAQRYGLGENGTVQKASVTDIDFDFIPHLSADEKLFTVKTENLTYFAHSVVLAVGAGNSPSIPRPFFRHGTPSACHAFRPDDDVLSDRLRARRTANVLVIGGGLTSAQTADRALRKGATKVFHLMRGPMKVKPFDVDLSWMGKFRNHEKASFWSADTDEERAELVKTARGGGSITPRFAKVLEEHVRSGKLDIRTHTTILSATFNPRERVWSIATEPPIPEMQDIHFVYFATGVQSDFQTLPYLQTIAEKYPVEAFDGLPALTDDLMWKQDVPLFMTGKFAALRLGPGAGNLEGARLGAERIAWAVQDTLGHGRGPSSDEEGLRDDGLRYAAGIGSRFEALQLEN